MEEAMGQASTIRKSSIIMIVIMSAYGRRFLALGSIYPSRIHVAVLFGTFGTALPFWELQSVPFELSKPLLQLEHPIWHSLVVLGSSLSLLIFHIGCETSTNGSDLQLRPTDLYYVST